MEWRGGAVLIAVAACGVKHGKRYSFPTQKKLCELVNEYHGFAVSERTVRREVWFLKRGGWFDVVRRTRREECGKRVFTSNLYKFRKKFFIWLESLEKLGGWLFKHFHRPKKAVNQLHKKRASLQHASSCVEKVLNSSSGGRGQPVFR